jgi:hypothetical protein
MFQTRREISALLKAAEGNLKKTQEIHRQLESLVGYIERVLSEAPTQKRKPPQ